MVDIVFVCPIIRLDFIKPAVESLYKFTDPSRFKLIVIDQSIEGLDKEWIDKNVHLYIRQKNQGFAQSANTGMRIALSWNVPYISVMNDDLLFIYHTWLEDALSEFETDPKIIAVNPFCPKIAMWGYGMTEGEYLEIMPYKSEFTPQDIAYLKAGDYDKAEIEARHSYKIPGSFPFTQRGVVDAFAGWLPIFKREGLIEIGLYDERFVWGGGEDYDWMGRCYSCAWPIPRDECNPEFHRRAVSTMKSWVWHHWGKSKDESATLDSRLFEGRESWNGLGDLWSPYCDPWGHTREDHKPLKRDPKVYVHIP